MSRIDDILANVRDTLSDSESANYRWDDATLMRFLNKGTKEIVNTTNCLRARLFVELEENAAIYDVSAYVSKFTRVQYLDQAIMSKTSVELDAINPQWQSEVGTEVKYVTFDQLPEGHIRIYPKVSGGLDNIDTNQVYGALVDITVNDDIFQIPSFNDIEVGLSQYLVLYVVKKPNLVSLTTLDSELELDSSYDSALEYFITGMALRSDSDTLSRTFGAEQLQLFANYLQPKVDNIEKSNNTVPTRVVKYTGAF